MYRRWEAWPFGGALVVASVGLLLPAHELPTGVTLWDKLSHAAIFAVLALTGRLAGLRPGLLTGGLLGYAVLTEVFQAILPIGRTGDWHDVVADMAGIGIGLVVTACLGWLLARAGRAGGAGRSAPPR